MLKDIYIIKNKINNKVYIGQAINSRQRFISHCSRASVNSDHSPIHDAINALGRENFYYEILESQIENYNEREKYWIKYYNSLVPNGYNLLEGGEEPPYHKGENCYNAILSDKQIVELQNDLINTRDDFHILAEKYGVNYKYIRNINYGSSRANNTLSYPLRKNYDASTYFNNREEDLKTVIWLLENSSCSMEAIGNFFGTNRKTIARINMGHSSFIKEKEYPIRKKKHRNGESIQTALLRMEGNNEREDK